MRECVRECFVCVVDGIDYDGDNKKDMDDHEDEDKMRMRTRLGTWTRMRTRMSSMTKMRTRARTKRTRGTISGLGAMQSDVIIL